MTDVLTRLNGGLRRLGAIAGLSLGLGLALGLLAPLVAQAKPLAEADARAVRQVVEAQLDALARDDAERAFSYASASIRAQFADAGQFMAMVRSGYPMVVRPAAAAFFQADATDVATDGAASAQAAAAPAVQQIVNQIVQLRDRDGRLWLANYLLERQGADGWRISGCVVVPDGERSST
ncbi:MAG: DUF4864 domain-containing protein [Leptothrix sp. (in: b-proteobacteria)]